MTPSETATILRQFNAWLHGNKDGPQLESRMIRKVIDAAVELIEHMEKQEPVAWRTFDGEGGYDYRSYEDNENYKLGWVARNPNHADWVEPLYALPGAKGE